MAYFRNSAINLLNLHYGIHALAISGGGAFFAVFLLKAGVPAPDVLMSFAAIVGGRFVIRPLVVPLAIRLGLKPVLISGSIATALEYPLLAQVSGVGPALYALIALSAIGDTLYWTTYHAYFASLGDDEHRGHQIGIREAIAAMIGIVGPLATGWALVAFGPAVAFGATAIVIFTAAIPLLFAPNVAVPVHAPQTLRAAWFSALVFASDGWFAAGFVFVWQIALFVSLGESFTAFGGAMAISALVGAVGGLFLGRLIDAGHGLRAVWLSLAVMAGVVVLRVAAYGNAPFAVVANALSALVICLYVPTLMSAVYIEAKRSPCTLRFHVATEGGWDVGCALGCLASAGLMMAGVRIEVVLLLPLIGAAAVFVLLRRYYIRVAVARRVALPMTGTDAVHGPEPETVSADG